MRLTMEELYRRLVMAESRVTSLERQLAIDLGTGLIAPLGRATLYVPFTMPGRVRLATFPAYRVPFDCTLTTTWANLTVASSSGAVTIRLNVGASDYDTTITATNTSATATFTAALSAGDLVIAETTATGTDAEDLSLLAALVPV
jgi:hypothetical protein